MPISKARNTERMREKTLALKVEKEGVKGYGIIGEVAEKAVEEEAVTSGTEIALCEKIVEDSVLSLQWRGIEVLRRILDRGVKHWTELELGEQQLVLRAVEMVLGGRRGKETGSYDELVHRIRREIK